jgi:hypothetical protein
MEKHFGSILQSEGSLFRGADHGFPTNAGKWLSLQSALACPWKG